ncbi:YraN family protein [Thiotrichales bacterium 19S3-7]|nr:YraN family protein [Thiotrichales bacterium 19S3-7]MCF6801568.1 YraN family protein [Thiotrichales bacterium 19S3-11]
MSFQAGKRYELKAKKLLQQNQYHIVKENFHSRMGEIDLIALNNNILVFVEVKYRHNQDFGHVLETVTLTKQKKLIKTAQFFLIRFPKFSQYQLRFDVIAFEKDNYYWIEDAFAF